MSQPEPVGIAEMRESIGNTSKGESRKSKTTNEANTKILLLQKSLSEKRSMVSQSQDTRPLGLRQSEEDLPVFSANEGTQDFGITDDTGAMRTDEVQEMTIQAVPS